MGSRVDSLLVWIQTNTNFCYSGGEDKHIRATLQAMEKQGVLNHSCVHSIFVGPARSGKNSLMERLLGNMPSSKSPSTGVAEAVV